MMAFLKTFRRTQCPGDILALFLRIDDSRQLSVDVLNTAVVAAQDTYLNQERNQQERHRSAGVADLEMA